MVRLVYIFLFQTNDNDNKHVVEFDISCGNLGNMTTSANTKLPGKEPLELYILNTNDHWL